MSTSTTPDDQSASTNRVTASDRLWAALRAHPGSTSEQLAVHAGVGQSTAGKILARWVTDATVTRDESGKGKRRGPATFTVAEPAEPSTDATDAAAGGTPTTPAATDGDQEPAADVDTANQAGETTAPSGPSDGSTPETGSGKQARLAPGGLRGMVEDYLREHPEENFGPAAIGKHLNRSSGAVANALDRLVADGYAVMTSPKPKRYAFAQRSETA